jgi:hypothetical protein
VDDFSHDERDEQAVVGRDNSLIAEVFRRYGGEYRKRHLLSREQRLAIQNICRCRTEELGGHLRECPFCDYSEVHYNSCRDRHCPLCQWMDQAEWARKQAERNLPIAVFMVTFTMPSEVSRIALQNPQLILGLLFQASHRTLQGLAKKQALGCLGVTSIAHTWSREMNWHPHVHSNVTSGGFDGEKWNPTKPNFLFSIEKVRELYRKRMIRGLRRLYKKHKLSLKGDLASLADPDAFDALMKTLEAEDWIVDIQPPKGDPEHATKYLSMYTRSVAISDHRMISVEDGMVTFKARDEKTLTLGWEEFIRRFLLHVLPSGFRKVRHYGLYSNSSGARLEEARRALRILTGAPAQEPKTTSELTWQERIKLVTGVDPSICPRCKRPGMTTTIFGPRRAVKLAA